MSDSEPSVQPEVQEEQAPAEETTGRSRSATSSAMYTVRSTFVLLQKLWPVTHVNTIFFFNLYTLLYWLLGEAVQEQEQREAAQGNEEVADQEPEQPTSSATEQETSEVQEQEETITKEEKPEEPEVKSEQPVTDQSPPLNEEPAENSDEPAAKSDEPATAVQEEEAKPDEVKDEAGSKQEAPKEPEIQPVAPEGTAAATTEGEEAAKKETKEAAVAEEVVTEEVKEKSKRPSRSKVRSTVPTEGVEIAMGDGNLEGAEPITFGQQFKLTVEKYAECHALCWKEKEGEGEESAMVWKKATFADYYKLCIKAAKSLLKVNSNLIGTGCPPKFANIKVIIFKN